jgi:hypothetical protein
LSSIVIGLPIIDLVVDTVHTVIDPILCIINVSLQFLFNDLICVLNLSISFCVKLLNWGRLEPLLTGSRLRLDRIHVDLNISGKGYVSCGRASHDIHSFSLKPLHTFGMDVLACLDLFLCSQLNGTMRTFDIIVGESLLAHRDRLALGRVEPLLKTFRMEEMGAFWH